MTMYAFNRAINQNVGCPLSKYVLCLLAYYQQFSIISLTRRSELTPQQIEEALQYLVDKKLIKFRDGNYEGQDGTEYQIEILF